MFFMHNFKGFPMPYNCFFAGTGFFPAKRAFCPFCHIYARALSLKIDILQAHQAIINVFCVKFQELSNDAFAFQLYRAGHRWFFPPNEYFSAFFKKNN